MAGLIFVIVELGLLLATFILCQPLIKAAWGRLRHEPGRGKSGQLTPHAGIMGGSNLDKMLGKPTRDSIRQRMATRVIAPPKNDAERRLFFLHEVQFHTELPLRITADDVLHVTKREMKTLTEYCTIYANPVGDPKRLFLLHDLRISVEKDAATRTLSVLSSCHR